MLLQFKDDDNGYLAWLKAHPTGCVLNVRRVSDAEYVVLHRAICPTISRTRYQGAYTGRGYRKWCSDDLRSLQKAAALEGRLDGTFFEVLPNLSFGRSTLTTPGGADVTVMKNNIAIDSLEAWRQHAGPKRAEQWKDGRSAKELARIWMADPGRIPPAVSLVLETHEAFGQIEEWQAEPEQKLRFDDFRGEPRNCDLVVHARDRNGPFVLAVEAKADEPFGETAAAALANALDRRLENPGSNGLLRIQQLASALLGPRLQGEAPLRRMRYQLLTACAGAIAHAERHHCSRAIMLVHEFVTEATLNKLHKRNTADFDRFAGRLSHGTLTAVSPGQIYGPFELPGAPLFSKNVGLYLGKVVSHVRSTD